MKRRFDNIWIPKIVWISKRRCVRSSIRVTSYSAAAKFSTSEVREYFKNSRAVFPDQRNRLIAMHETDDAMIVEFDLMGTHKGAMRDVAPTRKTFTQRMIAMFVFPPGGDHIICERVYFDSLNIQRQLGLLAA
jgi:predicted ester cyclase